jgi:hypothetical protein
VVIDPWTTECEVRKVTGISGLDLTVAALTYAHSTDDAVIYATNPTVNVKWFGALGDGTTNDYTAITRAHTQAESLEQPLYFPDGTYDMGSSDIDIDVSKTSWIAENAILDITSAPTSYVLRLYSSTAYATRMDNIRCAMKGIKIEGGTQASPYSKIGLKIGGGVTSTDALFWIDGVYVEGYTTALEFDDNAWRVAIYNSHFRWGDINVPSTITNAGEDMQFINCFFGDVRASTVFPELKLNRGYWHFRGCSFDNATIRLPSTAAGISAFVTCEQCHFEQPSTPSKVQKYIYIDDSEGAVILRDCEVVLSLNGANDREAAMFEVASGNADEGLILEGLRLFQNSKYKPEVNDSHRVLVAGGGRVQARRLIPWDSGYFYALSESANHLYNGDFETGNTNGWSTSTSGSGAISTPGSPVKYGSYSLLLSAPGAGDSAQVYQDLEMHVGEWAWATFWRRVDSDGDGGSRPNTALLFYAQDGTLITSTSNTYSATDGDWTVDKIGYLAPKGTVLVRFRFTANGAAADAGTMYIDSAILSII